MENTLQFILVLFLITHNSVASRHVKEARLQMNERQELLNRVEYLASLRTAYGDHTCSGALIAPRVVLTAAHCLNFINLPTVEFGRFERRGTNESTVEAHETVEFILHEDYNRTGSRDKNVALLILDKASSRNPIALASDDSCFHQELSCELQLIGWGTPPSSSSPSDTLQESHTTSLDHKICQQFLGTTIVTEVTICGGKVVDGESTSCRGDPGGPVILNGEQVGIVSMGIGCGGSTVPGVYTSIPQLKSWIARKLQMYVQDMNPQPREQLKTVEGPTEEKDKGVYVEPADEPATEELGEEIDVEPVEKPPTEEIEEETDAEPVEDAAPDEKKERTDEEVVEEPAMEQWPSPECDCSQDGVSGGIPTERIGCKQHLLESGDDDVFCMTVGGSKCQNASPSKMFKGSAWRLCDPVEDELEPEPWPSPECDCAQDGVSAGISTKRIGCAQHLLLSGDDDVFCMTVGGMDCLNASPSTTFEGAAWRLCDPDEEENV